MSEWVHGAVTMCSPNLQSATASFHFFLQHCGKVNASKDWPCLKHVQQLYLGFTLYMWPWSAKALMAESGEGAWRICTPCMCSTGFLRKQVATWRYRRQLWCFCNPAYLRAEGWGLDGGWVREDENANLSKLYSSSHWSWNSTYNQKIQFKLWSSNIGKDRSSKLPALQVQMVLSTQTIPPCGTIFGGRTCSRKSDLTTARLDHECNQICKP